MIFLETTLRRLFSILPGIGDRTRLRVARNAWWIVFVIGVLLGAYLLLQVAVLVSLQYVLANALASFSAHIRTLIIIMWTIDSIGSIAVVCLLSAAVLPLRHDQARGWKLAYGAVMLLVLIQFVVPIIGFIIGTLLPGGEYFRLAGKEAVVTIVEKAIEGVLLIVALYLLLQTRDHFKATKAARHRRP